jgi:hypothetical protein
MNWTSQGPRWYAPSSDLQAIANSAGAATVRTKAVPGGHQWLVDTIVVATTSALPGEALVYLGDPSISTFQCGSGAANNDTADGTPIIVPEGAFLTIVWSGQTPGATCTARVHYDDQLSTAQVVDSTPTRFPGSRK